MKLRYDADKISRDLVEGKASEENRKGWYNKFMGIASDLAVKAAKTACMVAVPVIIAGCSCSKIELNGYSDAASDNPADTAVDDAATDDVTEEDVAEEDMTEEEPVTPVPCPELEGTAQVRNLIGDYLNRRLNDRVGNDPVSSDAAYLFGGSDVSENANPFEDGEGNTLGPSEMFMHRVTGDRFVPLADYTADDEHAAKTYGESQSIWMRGSSYYDVPLGDVVGDVRFVAYTIKLKGESDDFGIPVCSSAIGGDYTHCKSGAEDADYNLSTESHKVSIMFMGEPWIITEMSPAYAVDGTLETKVYNGGFVKIAQEAVSGIVNQYESLLFDGLRFQLDDLEEHGGVVSAVISVLNEAGDVLKRDRVSPGQTKEFSIDGEIYKLHVYAVAPGYTMGAKWADMAILSREIRIEDGQNLDPDSGAYREWDTVVGWKKVGNSLTEADHLRMIAVYADDIADITGRGDTKLLRNEGFQFPFNFGVCYGGLDITDEELYTLTFTLERDSDLENHLPDYLNSDCVIYAPYVTVTSEIPFAGTSVDGENVNTLYVAMNGGGCRSDDGSWLFEMESGDMAASIPGRYFVSLGYHAGMMMPLLEDASGNYEVSIGWSAWEDGGVGYGDPARAVDNMPVFMFKIGELAGGDYSMDEAAVYFATDGESFNLDVNYTDTGESVFRSNHFVYQYAGPVNIRNSFGLAETGTITERGSVFVSMDDTQVVYYVADRVAYSVYYIGSVL